jgi:hypothetical protein
MIRKADWNKNKKMLTHPETPAHLADWLWTKRWVWPASWLVWSGRWWTGDVQRGVSRGLPGEDPGNKIYMYIKIEFRSDKQSIK